MEQSPKPSAQTICFEQVSQVRHTISDFALPQKFDLRSAANLQGAQQAWAFGLSSSYLTQHGHTAAVIGRPFDVVKSPPFVGFFRILRAPTPPRPCPSHSSGPTLLCFLKLKGVLLAGRESVDPQSVLRQTRRLRSARMWHPLSPCGRARVASAVGRASALAGLGLVCHPCLWSLPHELMQSSLGILLDEDITSSEKLMKSAESKSTN